MDSSFEAARWSSKSKDAMRELFPEDGEPRTRTLALSGRGGCWGARDVAAADDYDDEEPPWEREGRGEEGKGREAGSRESAGMSLRGLVCGQVDSSGEVGCGEG